MDFRKINSQVERKQYPLPTINEMMQVVQGFEFASVLDLNMGYLSIFLDEESRKLLTIIMPFDCFEYCQLPMGIMPATNIFQARIVSTFQGMREKRPHPYIDDIFHSKGGNFEEHLTILDEILRRLKKDGWQVNAIKSLFASHKVEFLGFEMNRNGFNPTQKRVTAILKLSA